MIANIIVGVCMMALVMGMIYGIYMAYKGVWNNEWYLVKKNSMDRNTNYKLYHMVLYNWINNVFNKGIVMSKQEIIEQLKNIKDQWANDTKGEINADVIIEALTDIIHDTEGNDGMDFSEEYDEHYDSFENVDFTTLEVN